MKTFARFAGPCLLLPLLMGAATLTHTVTPNPGGTKNNMSGQGSWSIDAGCTYQRVQWVVTLKSNGQTTQNADSLGTNGNWSVVLLVVPGTYNPCLATLYWKDANNMVQSLDNKLTTDYTVQ